MFIFECKKKIVTWNLGSESSFPNIKTEEVIALTAYGDELKLILDQYIGIPHTKETSQIWVGDFARQIFANLVSVIASYQMSKQNDIGTGLME